MPLSFTPRNNTLLYSLPKGDLRRVNSHLDLVQLELGAVVSDNGSYSKYAYFPVDCIISLLYVMENGDSAEVAMVGNEGIVGIAGVTGGESMLNRAVVQTAGLAYRMSTEAIRKEFGRGGAMQSLLLRFTQAMVTQMAQTAACNRHHSIEQQLCRWLLLSLDRLPSSEIVMTQELIANMLGVRRQGVVEAARKLQNAGTIQYNRGRINVLDRPQLEKCACECYAVVRNELDRLLEDLRDD
jgi:CRP-like cAMP-binding protein